MVTEEKIWHIKHQINLNHEELDTLKHNYEKDLEEQWQISKEIDRDLNEISDLAYQSRDMKTLDIMSNFSNTISQHNKQTVLNLGEEFADKKRTLLSTIADQEDQLARIKFKGEQN